MTATSRSSWVGASPRSTATTTDGRTSTSRAAPTPPRSIATRARSEESFGSPRCRIPPPTSRSVVGAYPVDIDGDGLIDLAVLRYGENVLLRGLGDCRFERANEAWGFDGGDAWTTAFSAKWEGSATLPTLAFGNYLDMSHGQQHATCADNELVRPKDGAATYGRADPAHARLVHPVDPVQRLGPVRAPRPADDQRPALLPRRRGAAVARRRRRASASLHPRRGLAADADLGHGHRQLRPHRRRPPGGVPDQPGRQQAPDARRRRRPAALPRHRARRPASPHHDRTRAATCCRPPPGTPSSRT